MVFSRNIQVCATTGLLCVTYGSIMIPTPENYLHPKAPLRKVFPLIVSGAKVKVGQYCFSAHRKWVMRRFGWKEEKFRCVMRRRGGVKEEKGGGGMKGWE